MKDMIESLLDFYQDNKPKVNMFAYGFVVGVAVCAAIVL